MAKKQRIRIDVLKRGGEISPLLFGHNLEHTRSCVWRGLSAQLVRNRKFAGSADRDGLARPWYRIGAPGCMYLIERARGRWGLVGEPYTAHFDPAMDPRCAGIQCQRMQGFTEGAVSGMGQRGIFLIEGKGYDGRLALRSERDLPVRIRLRGPGSGDAYFETVVRVSGEGWAEYPFRFVSPARDEDARLSPSPRAEQDCLGASWAGG